MRAQALRDQRGITLAELLVVVALIGIMMAGLFTLQHQGQSAYAAGAARVEVQQNARMALDRILTDLRSAQAITAVGAACNTAAGTTSISFNDQNGTATSYALAGTTLNRTDPVNGTVGLTGGVGSLVFQCFDGTNTATNVAADVRNVRVVIRTQSERGAGAYQPGNQRVVEESRVRLRNIL